MLTLFAACFYAIRCTDAEAEADADADGDGSSIYPWSLRYIEKRGFCAFANRCFLPGTVVNKSIQIRSNRIESTSFSPFCSGVNYCWANTLSLRDFDNFLYTVQNVCLSPSLPPSLPTYFPTMLHYTILQCTAPINRLF